MKKPLLLFAALLVAVLLWFAFAPTPRPDAAVGGQDAAAAPVARVAGDGPPNAAPPTANGDRTAVAAQPATASGALRVRVRARLGETIWPVADAAIDAWPGASPLPPFDATLRRANTDADGDLVLSGLAAGAWHVQKTADDRTAPVAATVPAAGEALVEFEMPAQKIARGRVVDADGAPVAGAELWIHRGAYTGAYSLREPTDVTSRWVGRSAADGTFAVPVLDRDRSLGASHPAYGESLGRMLPNDSDAIVLVLLRATASLTAIVRDPNGNPVAGALVLLEPPGKSQRRTADGTLYGPRVPRLGRTDAAGRCTFAGLAPGEQQVTASAEPHLPAGAKVEVADGAHAEVPLTLGECVTLVGAVRTADGTPARVHLTSRPSRDERAHWSECDAREDGSYVLRNVPRQTVWVVATSYGGTVVGHREVTSPPAGVVRCDLVLDDVHALRGRLVTSDHRPLVGWRIDTREGTDTPRRAATDRDGAFTLLLSEAGAHAVSAAPGDAPQQIAATFDLAGPGPHELIVPNQRLPSASLRGRLVAADGTPQTGCSLHLETDDGEALRKATTADDGSFVFAELTAGTWQLTLYRSGKWLEIAPACTLAHGEQQALGDLVQPALATLVASFTHADGSPWRTDAPGIDLLTEDGGEVAVDRRRDGAVWTYAAPPGTYRTALHATDLLAEPRTVTLTAGATTRLELPVAPARTFQLLFACPSDLTPAKGSTLPFTVRAADGAVARSDTAVLRSALSGERHWLARGTLPYGTYEANAVDAAGHTWRRPFVLQADVEAPTDFTVPLDR